METTEKKKERKGKERKKPTDKEAVSAKEKKEDKNHLTQKMILHTIRKNL